MTSSASAPHRWWPGGAYPPMTSPAWHSSATQNEAGKHELVAEPVPAEVSIPVPALPSRPAPTGVRAAPWVPPNPEILRRVKAALDRL